MFRRVKLIHLTANDDGWYRMDEFRTEFVREISKEQSSEYERVLYQ